MPRPRLVTLSALACVATLMLAGCGNSDDPAADSDTPTPSTSRASSTSGVPSPTDSNTSSTTSGALPEVKGGFGDKPTITVPDADPPSDLQVKTLEEGDGEQVQAKDTIVVNYAGVRWADGTSIDSSFERGSPVGFAIGVGQVLKGWDQALVGQTVGSRVLMVLPPDLAYGDQSQGPIQPGDTLVFVVDILGSYAGTDSAQGTPTPTEDDSLPAVTVLPKKPEIFVPPGKAPPKLIAIPVVTGKGKAVKSGDTVVVQYVGVTWDKGKEFDSSWDRGSPFVTQIGVGQVIPGWDQGLVGQKVGSRVLLVVPAKLGYGNQGSGSIKPGESLVFAVDILAAY